MINKLMVTGSGFNSISGISINSYFKSINDNLSNYNSNEDIVIDPQGYLGTKGLRFLSRPTKLFCNVAFQSIYDSSLFHKVDDDTSRVGIYDCSELPNLWDVFVFDSAVKNDGPDLSSPMMAPNIIANVSASQMAIFSKIKGPNFTIGANDPIMAIYIAMLQIGSKKIDYAIVGSAEIQTNLHKTINKALGHKMHEDTFKEVGASIVLENYNPTLNRLCVIEAIKISTIQKNTSYSDSIYKSISSIVMSDEKIDAIIMSNVIDSFNLEKFIGKINDSNIFVDTIINSENNRYLLSNVKGILSIFYSIGLFEDKIKYPNIIYSKSDTAQKNYKKVVICYLDEEGNIMALKLSK